MVVVVRCGALLHRARWGGVVTVVECRAPCAAD